MVMVFLLSLPVAPPEVFLFLINFLFQFEFSFPHLFQGFYGNEDVTHTYAGYISRSFQVSFFFFSLLNFSSFPSPLLQAQSQVECYTGKGVVHNKDDLNVLSSNPMPKYWNRTFATISTVPYNFQSFSPDAGETFIY